VKPRFTIRTKLLVAILLILLVSYATLIVTTLNSYESFIAGETTRELEANLNFAQKQYLVRAEQLMYSLLHPAAASRIQDALMRRNIPVLKKAMGRWQEITPFVEFITIVDAGKTVVARVGSEQAGDRFDLNDLLDQAFQGKKTVISTELLSAAQLCREGVMEYCRDRRYDEAMVIVVAIPVIDAAGTVIGGIVAADVVNKDPFLPFQVKGIFGKETELSIFQRGMRIASSLLEDEQVTAKLAPEVMAKLSLKQSYRGETRIAGKIYMSAFEPIINGKGDFIGALSVAISMEDMRKIRHESERNIVMSAFVGIILSVTITFLAARRLTAPLKALSRGAEQIEQGDLDQRVTVTSADEFGLLADSFNKMASALVERDRTITKKTRDLEELNTLLKELNEHLEKKVTERTSELRMEMGVLEAILTSMVEGVVVTDHENRVILFNPAAQKIFDLVPHRVLHQPIEQVCEHFGFPYLSEFISEIRTGGDTSVVREEEVSFMGKKLKVGLSPLLDEGGDLSGVVMSIRDVTVEEEVDRMKTEFISTVSHELKTPLTSIKGALQFIMNKAKWLTGTERELLIVCLRNTERLIRLINDILDISKIESGRVELNFKAQSVAELAIYAVEEIKGFALSRNVTIVNSVGDHLPPIYGDHDRLIQVLTNLLSNAVKFSPEGKVIMVSAERLDNYVTVAVADHGQEIQWSDRDKLFKKFQQLHNPDMERQGGTGLGLAICKEIIERHHGRIFYQSGTNGGNIFSFSLPIYEEQ
jgi:PAS domain S-box-containing protein